MLRASDQHLDESSGLVGLSAANTAAALSGTFVVDGSPTQTAMVESSGGQSQLAQVATAIAVAFVLLFLTKPLQYLPRCVLGAIVFFIAVRLIDVRGLRDIRRESPGEYALAVFTAAVVVLVGVEQGILLAMVLSLLRIVRHSYRPHTGVFVVNEGEAGRWSGPFPVRGHENRDGGLSVRGRALLRQRRPVCRADPRPGWANSFTRALAGRRCRSDYECGLHGGPDGTSASGRNSLTAELCWYSLACLSR